MSLRGELIFVSLLYVLRLMFFSLLALISLAGDLLVSLTGISKMSLRVNEDLPDIKGEASLCGVGSCVFLWRSGEII